mmetsp:Transcript_39660/g.86435  ORF Transcript_39660/g.86435 Transcript_39660/m.86435 type:complete len:1055 (+) Transcript_39660:1870-5034(+)
MFVPEISLSPSGSSASKSTCSEPASQPSLWRPSRNCETVTTCSSSSCRPAVVTDSVPGLRSSSFDFSRYEPQRLRKSSSSAKIRTARARKRRQTWSCAGSSSSRVSSPERSASSSMKMPCTSPGNPIFRKARLNSELLIRCSFCLSKCFSHALRTEPSFASRNALTSRRAWWAGPFSGVDGAVWASLAWSAPVAGRLLRGEPHEPSSVSRRPPGRGPFLLGDFGGRGDLDAPGPGDAASFGETAVSPKLAASPGPGASRSPRPPKSPRRNGPRPGGRRLTEEGSCGSPRSSRPATGADQASEAHTAPSTPEKGPAHQARREVKAFLEAKEGSVLRAWLKHFDKQNEQRISNSEFNRALRNMGFPGDVQGIFMLLDADLSGELTLEELDPAQDQVWRRFRALAVRIFADEEDFLRRWGSYREKSKDELRRPGTESVTTAGLHDEEEHVVTVSQFLEGLQSEGWDAGSEQVLFDALDPDGDRLISGTNMKWLTTERRRQERKDQAKRRAQMETAYHAKSTAQSSEKAAEAVLADFKAYVKRKYGHYIRAWRSVLSPDGAMVLQRKDLCRACNATGWQGDVWLLYKALDNDSSGYIGIEELDPQGALTLARFQHFVMQKFGSAAAAFRALDKRDMKILRQPEFCASLKGHGFQHPTKSLFAGLDSGGAKRVVEEDLHFLERWKPPAYLVADPNPAAAQELKNLLLKKYKNFLRAWRHVLDTDGSNQCSYDEFVDGCKRLGFKGDVAGAWCTLDDDMSRTISLGELDPVSCEILAGFRRWCDREFGSVKSAFSVFDVSGDNQVSTREFRRSLRVYGYEGNNTTIEKLFVALDTDRRGNLSMDEVIFLDAWIFEEEEEDEDEEKGGGKTTGSEREAAAAPKRRKALDPGTLVFINDTPGPGTYNVPGGIGAVDSTPMVRFSGAFAFTKRPVAPFHGVPKDAAGLPSPSTYDDRVGRHLTSPNKNGVCFGSEQRPMLKAPLKKDADFPGPCTYLMPRRSQGLAASITPRRVLRMHPLCNSGLRPIAPEAIQAPSSPRNFQPIMPRMVSNTPQLLKLTYGV